MVLACIYVGFLFKSCNRTMQTPTCWTMLIIACYSTGLHPLMPLITPVECTCAGNGAKNTSDDTDPCCKTQT